MSTVCSAIAAYCLLAVMMPFFCFLTLLCFASRSRLVFLIFSFIFFLRSKNRPFNQGYPIRGVQGKIQIFSLTTTTMLMMTNDVLYAPSKTSTTKNLMIRSCLFTLDFLLVFFWLSSFVGVRNFVSVMVFMASFTLPFFFVLDIFCSFFLLLHRERSY